MTRRSTYRLDLRYDGSRFAGFARQPSAVTVESVLLDALSSFVPDLRGLACGGRTDRGVHAEGQVVSFWSKLPLMLDDVTRAVDAAAPGALSVVSAREAPRSFHASFSATRRHYRYLYVDDGALDADALDALLRPLEGRRCFAAFARRTSPGRSTVRHMFVARAMRDRPDRLRFQFSANGFLRRQVRVMVATVLCQARRGASSDALLLLSRAERSATSSPADPDGLCLTRVDYG